MKTREEIENLKINWLEDPCYDLEDVEGFEDVREELLAFRQAKEQAWREGEQHRVNAKAEALKVSVDLVYYIEDLEYRLKQLGLIVERMRNNNV